jgi:quercetin dioxygenase-like cupin family protein
MKYLIDLNDPENFIAPVTIKAPDGYVLEDQHTLIMPEGPRRHFTMTDSVMHTTRPGADPHYHEHYWGYEVFFVDSGGMDVYINGQKAYIKPGSILFLQPYQAHGMFFYADTKYRGFFHDLPYNDEGEAGMLLRKYHPDYMTDPEFPVEIRPLSDHFLREPPYDFKEVPPEECQPIRHKDRPMAQFELPGAAMKMLAGRWENGGLCELWCFEMKKGFYAESYPFPANADLYYVTDGEVKFKVYDEEFVAKAEHLVKIPKYAPRSFEALTESVMYDVGGLPRWYAYLADRESVMALDPERAAKPETLDELRKKLGVHYKEFGVR